MVPTTARREHGAGSRRALDRPALSRIGRQDYSKANIGPPQADRYCCSRKGGARGRNRRRKLSVSRANTARCTDGVAAFSIHGRRAGWWHQRQRAAISSRLE